MRNCEYCGRPLTEGQETYCSPECEAAAQGENPKRRGVHEAQCTRCGKTFVGGYAARYCPECKPIVRRESVARSLARRARGEARRPGDICICEACGKPFTRTGTCQKICRACARERDIARQRDYYRRVTKPAGNKGTKPYSFVADRNEERTCPVCGNTFIRSGTHRVYCSPACAAEVIRRRQCDYYFKRREAKADAPNEQEFAAYSREKICAICGSTFIAGRAHRVYCSPECAVEGKKRTQCEYYAKKREAKADSPEEQELAAHSKEKTCPVCGNTFICDKPHQVYCSRECAVEGARRRQCDYYAKKREAKAAAPKDQEFAAHSKEKTCPVCGKTFIPTRAHRIYCSRECAAEGEKRNRYDYYARRRRANAKAPIKKEKKVRETAARSEEKICPICGKTFISGRARQIYCSPACKYIGQKRRQRAQWVEKRKANPALPTEKICPICGSTFAYCKAHQFYCSLECAKKAINQRNRARSSK